MIKFRGRITLNLRNGWQIWQRRRSALNRTALGIYWFLGEIKR